MASTIKKPFWHCRGFTLVEFLVVLTCIFFFAFLLPWTFNVFVFWGTLGTAFGIMAVLSAFRRKWKAFCIAFIPMIAFYIPFFLMFPTVFPMQLARIKEAHYVETPLVQVLSDISAQKEDFPFWRFHIEDRRLAKSKVTVDIPDRCRLGMALQIISEKTNCDMKWYWNRFCGNAPSPNCACFRFYRHGSDYEKCWDSRVIVNRDCVFGLEEEK
jgi:hypothetical protein